jgi:hypothetical protein
LAICERSAPTSDSVRSFTLVVGSTPAAAQATSRARVRPHAEDVGQTDDDVLVHRDVDAGNTCHFSCLEAAKSAAFYFLNLVNQCPA